LKYGRVFEIVAQQRLSGFRHFVGNFQSFTFAGGRTTVIRVNHPRE
jgi:hypothetical protein